MEDAGEARRVEKPLDEFAVTVRAAFLPDLPTPSSKTPTLLPDAVLLRLPGTFAGMRRADFHGEVLPLRGISESHGGKHEGLSSLFLFAFPSLFLP